MKDLSKFDAPKKNTANTQETKEPQQTTNPKKKKIIVITIIALLAIAVGSKLINKHLKKKSQEQALLAKSPANKKDIAENEATKDKKTKEKEKPTSNKMIFTFYDHLKNESVEVDASPSAQRDQYKYSYIYQIASFRNMNETRHYVQKMEKVGLKPKFKKVGSWIRMYIGPYDNKRAIAPDIIKLQRMGLNGGFTREISRTKIEPKDDSKKKDNEAKHQDNKNTDN